MHSRRTASRSGNIFCIDGSIDNTNTVNARSTLFKHYAGRVVMNNRKWTRTRTASDQGRHAGLWRVLLVTLVAFGLSVPAHAGSREQAQRILSAVDGAYSVEDTIYRIGLLSFRRRTVAVKIIVELSYS